MADVRINIDALDNATRVLNGVSRNVEKLTNSIARNSRATAGAGLHSAKWNTGLSSARGSTLALASALKTSAVAYGSAGIAIFGATKALQGYANQIKTAIQVGGDFEQSLSRVKALSGATDDQFQMLDKRIRELGASTIFTSRQVAEGAQFLARAGFDANQIVGALPATLATAAAGALDLGRASDLVTNIMQGFGIAAEDTMMIADQLTETFTSSNVSLEELGQTMKFAAPVAQSLGVTMNDLAAATGILGNAGLKAGIAGRNLRSFMIKLIDPSKEAQGVMEQYSIAVRDAEGNMRSLPGIISEFERTLGGLTDKDKQEALAKIFDRETLSSALVLLKAGGAELQRYSNQIERATGRATEIAAIQTDNWLGSLTRLSSRVEAFRIELSRSFLPVLTRIVDNGFIPFIDKIRDSIDVIKTQTSVFEDAGGRIAAAFDQLFTSLGQAGGTEDILSGLITGTAKFVEMVVKGIARIVDNVMFLIDVYKLAQRAIEIFFKAPDFSALSNFLQMVASSWLLTTKKVIGIVADMGREIVTVHWANIWNAFGDIASVAVSVVKDSLLDLLSSVGMSLSVLPGSIGRTGIGIMTLAESLRDIENAGNQQRMEAIAAAVTKMGEAHIGAAEAIVEAKDKIKTEREGFLDGILPSLGAASGDSQFQAEIDNLQRRFERLRKAITLEEDTSGIPQNAVSLQKTSFAMAVLGTATNRVISPAIRAGEGLRLLSQGADAASAGIAKAREGVMAAGDVMKENEATLKQISDSWDEMTNRVALEGGRRQKVEAAWTRLAATIRNLFVGSSGVLTSIQAGLRAFIAEIGSMSDIVARATFNAMSGFRDSLRSGFNTLLFGREDKAQIEQAAKDLESIRDLIGSIDLDLLSSDTVQGQASRDQLSAMFDAILGSGLPDNARRRVEDLQQELFGLFGNATPGRRDAFVDSLDSSIKFVESQNSFLNRLKLFGSDMQNALVDGFQEAIVQVLVDKVSGAMAAMADFLITATEPVWGPVFNGIKSLGATVMGGMWDVVRMGYEAARDVIMDNVFPAFKTIGDLMFKGLRSAGSFLWDIVDKAYSKAVDFVLGDSESTFNTIGQNMTRGLSQGSGGLWGGITAGWDRVRNALSEVGGFFVGIAQSIVNALGTVGGEIWDGISLGWTKLKGALGDVGSFFIDIGNKIKDPIVNASSFLWSGISDGWVFLRNNLSDVGSFFWAKAGEIRVPIDTVSNGLWNGIKEGWDALKGGLVDVGSFFDGLASDISGPIGSLGGFLWGGIVDGYDLMKKALDKAPLDFSNIGKGIKNGLRNGAVGSWDFIRDTYGTLVNFFANDVVGTWDGIGMIIKRSLAFGARNSWNFMKESYRILIDFFANDVTSTWDSIGGVIKKSLAFGGRKMWDFIREGYSALIQFFNGDVTGTWDGIGFIIRESLSRGGRGMWTFIQAGYNTLIGDLTNNIGNVWDGVGWLIKQSFKIGNQGMWTPLKAAYDTIVNDIGGTAGLVWDGIAFVIKQTLRNNFTKQSMGFIGDAIRGAGDGLLDAGGAFGLH